MRASLLLTAAVVALATPALADTKAGVDAWERGDYKTAVDQWRTAANGGDADARFNLGQAYKLGRGVPIDTQKAEDFYRQAAAQGHVQAADNYGLALFQNGKPRDAIPYLEQSTARGEPRAQYILGTMLFNGTDIRKDWVRAYALLTQSARAGLPQATQTLTQMDQYIPSDQRRAGIALADRSSQLPPPPVEVAGNAPGGVREVELPPSQSAARPVAPPSPVTTRSPTPPLAVRAPVVVSGRWRLQLGAFGDPNNARRLSQQLAGRFPGRTFDLVRSGTLTRVLVGPFASSAEAKAACGSVSPCVPVGP